MKTLTTIIALTLFSGLSYGGELKKLSCTVEKFNPSYNYEVASKSSTTVFKRNLDLDSALVINLQTKNVEMVANFSDDNLEDDAGIDSFETVDNKGKYLIIHVSTWKNKLVLTNIANAASEQYEAAVGDKSTTLAYFQKGIAVTCQK